MYVGVWHDGGNHSRQSLCRRDEGQSRSRGSQGQCKSGRRKGMYVCMHKIKSELSTWLLVVCRRLRMMHSGTLQRLFQLWRKPWRCCHSYLYSSISSLNIRCNNISSVSEWLEEERYRRSQVLEDASRRSGAHYQGHFPLSALPIIWY